MRLLRFTTTVLLALLAAVTLEALRVDEYKRILKLLETHLRLAPASHAARH